MKHGERISRSRLAMHRHEHATTGGQSLEYSSIVRLKSDTPQRSCQPELREIVCWTLKRGDKRSFRQHRSGRASLYPITLAAERRFDQRGNLWPLLRDDADRLWQQPGSFQRINAFLRPLHVLKYADGVSALIHVNHGDVIYQGLGIRG